VAYVCVYEYDGDVRMAVSESGLGSWLDVNGGHSDFGTLMSKTLGRRPDIMAIYQPYLQLASCHGLAKTSALAVAVRSVGLNRACPFSWYLDCTL